MAFSFTGQVANAKTTDRGEYFGPGDYRVRIDLTKPFTSRKHEDFYVVECEILTSNNPQHPAGTKRNWMQKMAGDSLDMAFGNLKSFAAAAAGIDLREIPADQAASVGKYLEDQLQATLASDGSGQKTFAGKEVNLHVKATKTKSGGDFNQHTFSATAEAKAALAG